MAVRFGVVKILDDGRVLVDLVGFDPSSDEHWQRVRDLGTPEIYANLAQRMLHFEGHAARAVAKDEVIGEARQFWKKSPQHSSVAKGLMEIVFRAAAIAILAVACLAGVRAQDLDRTLDLPVLPEAPKRVRNGPYDVAIVSTRYRTTDKPVVAVPSDPPPEDGEDKPPTIYGVEIKSENDTVFFVIDVSGSMGLERRRFVTWTNEVRMGDRLDRAKNELGRAIATLPESFRFNALAYDCTSAAWRAELAPATEPNKIDATAWVNGLVPGGGTGTGPAVAQALGARETRLVVLLTDGDPNCYLGSASGSLGDPAEHRRLIRQANEQQAAVNVFGIGATGQFERFCQAVANENHGTYTEVR